METRYRRHANGCIAEIATYSKGRRHGPTAWFYNNGKLERVAEFWYDQLHGDYYEFWPNGKRALKAQYTYSALEDTEEFDEAGHPIPEKTEEAESPPNRHTSQDDRLPRSNTPNSGRGQPRNPLRRSCEHNGCSDCTEDDGTW